MSFFFTIMIIIILYNCFCIIAVEILVVKTMNNAGPVQTPTTADQLKRKAEFESKAEDQNDLTGGNLKMLAKSLRLLLKQKDEPEEEVALDIRPALVQASNLLVGSC